MRVTYQIIGALIVVLLIGMIIIFQLKIYYLEGEVILAKERLVYSTKIFSRVFKNVDLKKGMSSVEGGPYDLSGKAHYNGLKTNYYLYSVHPHSVSSVIVYEIDKSTFAINLYPPTYIFKRGDKGKVVLDKTGKPIRKPDRELLYLEDGLEKDNTHMILDYRYIDRDDKWHGLIDTPDVFVENK